MAIRTTDRPFAPAGPRALDKDGLKAAIEAKLLYAVGKGADAATPHDWFVATALAARDMILDRWIPATRATYAADKKRVYYLSLEFLIGRLLKDSLRNLGVEREVTAALADLTGDPEAVFAEEPDAALGNGGLGRLAACFMESMATLGIPAHGYGIRYEHGLFKQGLDRGWQVERPEDWLAFGNPWEFERSEVVYPVRFGGRVEEQRGPGGERVHAWKGGTRVLAVAYDTPVVGYAPNGSGEGHVNTLRLWSAQSGNLIDLEAFNRGDYGSAVAEQVAAESITRVLYPNDATPAGQELRLKQEYFFTAASIKDILRRHLARHGDVRSLGDHCAIQLNDTHPAIAVPELMRLLVDRHGLRFEEAWEVTRGTIHYTNHTLMPEALERWPVQLMERLLPRQLQVIYDVNARALSDLRGRPQTDDPFLADVSLIDESYGRFVRMGHLAFVGSRKVNGVSALHTNLMKRTVFKSLHRHFPDRIANKTNGVTPRRWLLGCNPELSALITDAIGPGWPADLERLAELEPHLGDASFLERYAAAKSARKQALVAWVAAKTGQRLDPTAMMDVQIKRIHEYKRQLLNVLEAIALWDALRGGEALPGPAKVKLLAGKAAPSYARAKLIIKLANDAGAAINREPATKDRLKLLFLPNYNVSLAEAVIPGSDLSEQVSTAGMEASGTGNMKFALNGAVTIGTLDGANVEIAERVGPENILIFGLTAEEVVRRKIERRDVGAEVAATPRLARVLEILENGELSPDDPGLYRPIVDDVRNYDPFMVAADFASYWDAQRQADALFAEPARWLSMSAANTARCGWFSSDRTIREYAQEIWRVPGF